MEINDQYHCPSERKVLVQLHKQGELCDGLSNKVGLDGFEVVLCPCDADTTIVKVALDAANGTPVTVYSDDTDLLCLLVPHVKVSTNHPGIFVTNMTRANNSQRLCYRIEDLISELDDMVCSTYCSVTCSLAVIQLQQFTNLVKLQYLLKSDKLQYVATRFYHCDLSPEEIGSSSIRYFELLHSSTHNLQQIFPTVYNMPLYNFFLGRPKF